MQYVNQTDANFFCSKTNKSTWRRKFGKLLYYFSEPAAELEHLARQAYIHKARSPGNRLSNSEINNLANFMLDIQDLDMRREYFENRPIEETFQGLSIPLIDWLIAKDSDVRSVLNIGAHYGYCDHILSKRHPKVSFLSVDFAANLREFNQEFISDNLDFKTGYALDLLEANELQPDAVLMSSTATVIKNSEIKRYLANISRLGSYMIFNEPLYNLPGGAAIDPNSIPTNESVPAYQYRMQDGSTGLLCYTHNYRSLILEAGFEVIYYKVFKPVFTDLHMLQIIAKKLPQ